MRNLYLNILSIFMLMFIWPMSAISAGNMGDSSISQMAGIMYGLNHYPDAEGKKALQKIIDNQSARANERTLAGAMMRLQHQVDNNDIAKLKAIIASDDATQNEKDLATIILNLNHTPSDKDKMMLKGMMN